MYRSLTLVGSLLLAVPLAFAQAPGPASGLDPAAMPGSPAAMPGPPGASARHNGSDRGMHGPHERDGRMHDEAGRDGLGAMHVPPGTWWRNPEVASRVGLSADQVKHIDDIFLESRVQLIHMHASLEEEQLRLEPLLAASSLNQQAALAQISKIADTRAELEKANARMLLSIRGVLTGDQWAKLQQHPAGPHDIGGPAATGGPHRPFGPNGPAAPGDE
jgi:Spy/CpxP family protein refolding chaperone